MHCKKISLLYCAFNNTVLFAPYRLTTRPARENTFPLEAALLPESHCLWLTMPIKHGHSQISFPPSPHHYYGHVLLGTA